jgi:hypothetical protein
MNEILVAIGGGLTGGKILEKLLGPTAEYLGQGMLSLAKKRLENIQRIFTNAEQKLGDRIESPGAVPPRVLAGVLNEGSYREDELEVEYFGGVLASARTEVSRDDRGASFVSLVSRLSSYQLRLHYITYRVFLELYGSSGKMVTMPVDRLALSTFIPQSALIAAMDFSGTENADTLLVHALVGLGRESLIDPNYAKGDSNTLHTLGYLGTDQGLIVQPSPYGVELFLYAIGAGHLPLNVFLLPGFTVVKLESIASPAGSYSLKAGLPASEQTLAPSNP